MTDEKIIELYWLRDESAIDHTKESYGSYIFSISYGILSSREDAEECENDTYLSAWYAIPPSRPAILSAFLGRIARNVSITRLRRKNAAKRGGGEVTVSLFELAECIPDGSRFDEELKSEELGKAISELLYSIKEADRNIFVRRYWHCESVSDICKHLGFGKSRVKMSLKRTREKLKKHLKEGGYFYE